MQEPLPIPSLLALPAEVRTLIYIYALTLPTGTLVFDPCTRRFNVAAVSAVLLKTGGSLRNETKHLPLQLNR